MKDLKYAIKELCFPSSDPHPPTTRWPPMPCPYNWTSIPMTEIGTSDLQQADTVSFPIPSAIPSSAREVLIHAGAHSGHSINATHSNLKIFTRMGAAQYEKYLLLLSCRQAEAVSSNSDNMWFPMPENRKVYVTVPTAHGDKAGMRLFAIGYR